jgi:hypothetical protein
MVAEAAGYEALSVCDGNVETLTPGRQRLSPKYLNRKMGIQGTDVSYSLG